MFGKARDFHHRLDRSPRRSAGGGRVTLVKCTVRDLMGELTQRRLTGEGFLVAPGIIARAGNVQEYRASELGFDVTRGMDANQIVRLYRPTSEVHSPETIASFEGQTLTKGHPFGGVDAETWQKVAIGDVRDVTPDGEGIKSEIVVRDAKAIKDIQSGKRQLSCGYTFDCDMTAGRTHDGKAYDGTMTNIRGNHVAVVDMARGGPGCRIADESHPDPKERPMALRKLVIDGLNLELEETQASIVEKIDRDAKAAVKTAADSVTAANAKATDAETKLAAEVKAKADLIVAHDAKVKELEAKILKPEQIEALATERAKVVGDAARICPDVKPEGKTVAAIRTEVVTAVLAGDSALKAVATAMLDGVAADKASPEAITSAFKACAAVPAADGASSGASDIDREVGRKFAGADGDKSRANDGAPVLSGRALMTFRQTHGGRSPSDVASQARR